MYPGNSNWYAGGWWQTWSGRKGDVARAMFYMDVRYEGGTHGITHAAEPDLILTDNAALIRTTSGNASVAYMGLLAVLVQWNAEDPADAREHARNDVVFGFQGNRNPFVDHPEWVNAMFVPQHRADDRLRSRTYRPTRAANCRSTGSAIPSTSRARSRRSPSTSSSASKARWVDVAVQPADCSLTYSLVIPTNDIASPSIPQPWIAVPRRGDRDRRAPSVSPTS